MTQDISALSAREAAFLLHLAGAGHTLFSIAEARDYWDDAGYTRNILSRLVRKGWLQRLQRGRYMVVPLEAGPERNWSENAWIVASHLIHPAAVAYWSALHYWAMTEQVPRIVFVQSTRRKRPARVSGVRFRFVTLSQSRFFGVSRRTLDGKVFYVTDREKTMLDAAARPDLSGGIGQLAEALRSSVGEMNWERLDQYLIRWGGGTPVKRLGYLADALEIDVPDRERRLQTWQQMISQGVSLLEPGSAPTGRVITRWRVRLNGEIGRIRSRRIDK